MGVKVKGNMWCDQCQRSVAGQKSTHRLRGVVSTVTAPVTAGASLLAVRSDAYHCPTCGGPVREISSGGGGAALVIGFIVVVVAISSAVAWIGSQPAVAVPVLAVAVLSAVGFGIWFLNSGSEARKAQAALTHRCEKNWHLLEAGHDKCPVDGSPVHEV